MLDVEVDDDPGSPGCGCLGVKLTSPIGMYSLICALVGPHAGPNPIRGFQFDGHGGNFSTLRE